MSSPKRAPLHAGTLPPPPESHAPGPDWTCQCGYDYFGGSAAYSWQLFEAHLPRATSTNESEEV